VSFATVTIRILDDYGSRFSKKSRCPLAIKGMYEGEVLPFGIDAIDAVLLGGGLALFAIPVITEQVRTACCRDRKPYRETALSNDGPLGRVPMLC
jgi:hypothetical protein